MKNLPKFRPWGLFGAVLTMFVPFCVPEVADAAQAKPAITVSVSSFQDVAGAAKKIAELTGNAEVFSLFEMSYARINGLDATKPWGIVLFASDEAFIPVAFFPITDLEAFRRQIPQIEFLLAQSKEISKTKYVQETQNGNFVWELKNKWFVFYPEQHAELLPADPTTLLNGRDKDHTFALHLDCESISEELVNMYLAPIELILAFQNPDAAEQFGHSKKQIARVLQEGKGITYGLSADKRTGTIAAEVSIAVKPGTSLAESLEYVKTAKSQYGGFYRPDGAATVISAGKISQDDAEVLFGMYESQFETWINEAGILLEDDPERAELAVATLESLRDIFKATAAKGKIDGAFSWLNSGEAIFGIAIAGGNTLDETLKKVVTHLTGSEPGLAEAFQLGYSSDLGYRWSRVKVPLSLLVGALQGENVPDISEFPEELKDRAFELLLAIRDDSVCAAFGFGSQDLEAKLKKAIGDSKTPVDLPSRQVVISLPGVGQAVGAYVGNDLLEVIAPLKAVVSILQNASQENQIVVENSYPEGGKDAVIGKTKITIPGAVIATIAQAVRDFQKVVIQEQLNSDPFEGTESDRQKSVVRDFDF